MLHLQFSQGKTNHKKTKFIKKKYFKAKFDPISMLPSTLYKTLATIMFRLKYKRINPSWTKY